MRRQNDKQQVIIQVFPHGGWKIALGGGFLAVLVILALVFRIEFGYYLIGAITLSLAWGTFRLFEYIRNSNNDFRAAKAQTDQIVFQSRFFIQDTRVGSFYIEAGEGGTIQDKKYYAATVSAQKAMLLGPGDEEVGPQKPDLLRVLTQPGTVYVLAGAQRSGKSWQAGHVADYWLSLGIAPAVFGTKADNPGYDWSGCDCLIIDDKAEMDRALRSIMAQCADRQKLLKAQRSPQPIILDDWIATLDLTKKTAYEFMALAATKMASSGIIAYFIMQGDTAAAFGLKELGAMLKNNFMQLNVIPIPASDGRVIPGQSRGKLIYPNTSPKDAVPVDLIEGRPRCFPDPAGLIVPAIEGAAVEAERSPEEIIRASLVEDPNLGIGKLQEIAWGSKGGSKHQERRDIIDRIRQETTVS